MSKITELTPEQIAKFPDYVAHWTRVGLQTGRPDDATVNDAVRRLYECGGLEPPAMIARVAD